MGINICYEKCFHDISKVSPSVEKLAEDHISKYSTKETTCEAMLKNQILKCITAGVITELGGSLTLLVTFPAILLAFLCSNAYDCLFSLYGRL